MAKKPYKPKFKIKLQPSRMLIAVTTLNGLAAITLGVGAALTYKLHDPVDAVLDLFSASAFAVTTGICAYQTWRDAHVVSPAAMRHISRMPWD